VTAQSPTGFLVSISNPFPAIDNNWRFVWRIKCIDELIYLSGQSYAQRSLTRWFKLRLRPMTDETCCAAFSMVEIVSLRQNGVKFCEQNLNVLICQILGRIEYMKCGLLWSVTWASVSLSVTWLRCKNKAEWIEVPFEVETLGNSRNIVLDSSDFPHGFYVGCGLRQITLANCFTGNRDCAIDQARRNWCPYCRLQKCFLVGMNSQCK